MAPIQGPHNSCCVELLPQPDPERFSLQDGIILTKCPQCHWEYVQMMDHKNAISFWRSHTEYKRGMRALAEELKKAGWRKTDRSPEEVRDAVKKAADLLRGPRIPPPSRAPREKLDGKDWTG